MHILGVHAYSWGSNPMYVVCITLWFLPMYGLLCIFLCYIKIHVYLDWLLVSDLVSTCGTNGLIICVKLWNLLNSFVKSFLGTFIHSGGNWEYTSMNVVFVVSIFVLYVVVFRGVRNLCVVQIQCLRFSGAFTLPVSNLFCWLQKWGLRVEFACN